MKNGFVLYCSQYATINKLSTEEKGMLLEAIFHYQMTGEEMILNSFHVEIVFSMVKQQLDMDNEKYQKIVDRNKTNGANGGRPKKQNQENPVGYLGNNENQEKPKKPDKDNVNINVNSNVKEKKREKFIPPTLNEISVYISENNLFKVDADRFFDHYTANGWVQGKGKPIKDWKAALRNWSRNDFQQNIQKHTHPANELFKNSSEAQEIVKKF